MTVENCDIHRGAFVVGCPGCLGEIESAYAETIRMTIEEAVDAIDRKGIPAWVPPVVVVRKALDELSAIREERSTPVHG